MLSLIIKECVPLTILGCMCVCHMLSLIIKECVPLTILGCVCRIYCQAVDVILNKLHKVVNVRRKTNDFVILKNHGTRLALVTIVTHLRGFQGNYPENFHTAVYSQKRYLVCSAYTLIRGTVVRHISDAQTHRGKINQAFMETFIF